MLLWLRAAHRKRIKHYHQSGDLHELTFSCYRRMPLLTADDWRRRLARTIDAAGQPGGGYDRNVVEIATVHEMIDYIHAGCLWLKATAGR